MENIEIISRLQAIHAAGSEVTHLFRAMLCDKLFVAAKDEQVFLKVKDKAFAKNAVIKYVNEREKFFELRYSLYFFIATEKGEAVHHSQYLRADSFITEIYKTVDGVRPFMDFNHIVEHIGRSTNLRSRFRLLIEDGYQVHDAIRIDQEGKDLIVVAFSKRDGLDSVRAVAFELGEQVNDTFDESMQSIFDVFARISTEKPYQIARRRLPEIQGRGSFMQDE